MQRTIVTYVRNEKDNDKVRIFTIGSFRDMYGVRYYLKALYTKVPKNYLYKHGNYRGVVVRDLLGGDGREMNWEHLDRTKTRMQLDKLIANAKKAEFTHFLTKQEN